MKKEIKEIKIGESFVCIKKCKEYFKKGYIYFSEKKGSLISETGNFHYVNADFKKEHFIKVKY